MNISRFQTDKLIVGTNDVSYVAPDTSPTGSAILNGPVLIGNPSAAPGYEGALNVSSNGASQNSLDTQPAYQSSLAIKADGNLTVAGDGKTANALLISGGSSVDTIHVIGDMFVSGSVDCGNKGKLAARFATADSLPPKAFDIEHPTKGKGWRLRYVCLEGPEAGVYFRGRLKNEKVIKLPDSWKGLVHTDSISVQLQPIGSHQNIIVKRWDDDFIYLQGQGLPIDCFYHVYGERKDVNSVLVEYEGNSRYDYPDPNWNENSEMSPEERNLRDPNYKYPRNTITG